MTIQAAKRCLATFSLLGLLLPGLASGQVTLILDAPHGLQGTSVQGGLLVDTDTPSAGVNAAILFSAGITVDSVLKGDLLTPPGDWQLAFEIDGGRLTLITWSATQTFTGMGEVIKLMLTLDPGLVGLRTLDFATINPDPPINSRHAISNSDGTISLAHDVVNASFLAYSSTSDYDMDGMPDQWEIDNELDPLNDNADEDADEDGHTDLEEYEGGSDPQNPLSVPDKFFDHGFELGGAP